MRIIITGASGLIGLSLTERLTRDGHDVVALRRPRDWDPGAGRIDSDALVGADAVVHLAGEPIGDKRWSEEQKDRIRRSRIDGTTLLANAMAEMADGPKVLLSGSAIGFYGNTGDREIDETAPAGDDFLAGVCVDWERAAEPAADAGLRVVFLRTGIVLSTKGGALARQLPFFKWCLGGRSGPGTQYQSWITIDDDAAAIAHLLTAGVSGAVNLTAPNPVTNREFSATLGRAVHRPTTVIPMFGPRLLYGRDLADSLLLASQRVVPSVLEQSGFQFEHPTLDAALRHLLA